MLKLCNWVLIDFRKFLHSTMQKSFYLNMELRVVKVLNNNGKYLNKAYQRSFFI